MRSSVFTALLAGLAGLAAGCGGGDWFVAVGAFTVWDSRPGSGAVTIQFDGTTFVPAGASCHWQSSPLAPSACQCDVGPLASGTWQNQATGQTGNLELTVIDAGNCIPVETFWRSPAIALGPGANPITLSMADGRTRGGSSITVLGP